MKKGLKVYLLACLILCCGAFVVWSYGVEAGPEVAVVSELPQPVAIPARVCDGDSHRSCIGKADGDACVEGGNPGHCLMVYPTSECLCY